MLEESAPKRRGRPKKRREPEPSPIDGDYAPLDIVGKKPGFAYMAFSDADRRKRGHQFEVERWSEDCAHPPWDVFSEEKRNQEVKVNGQLTLMRAPQARVEARRRRELDSFRALSKGIAATNEDQGRSVTETRRPDFEFDISKSY